MVLCPFFGGLKYGGGVLERYEKARCLPLFDDGFLEKQLCEAPADRQVEKESALSYFFASRNMDCKYANPTGC